MSDAGHDAMKSFTFLLFASGILNASEISVRVYNTSKIVPATLDRAMREASRIFGQAGVEIRWEEGDPNAQEAHETDQSAPTAFRDRHVRDYLVLRIGRGLAANTPKTALGISYPYAQLGASATVFEERIEDVCQTPGIDFAVVLGYAIAHELGHVVLVFNGHSSTGIMRARFGPTELRAAQLGILAFTPDQAIRMRRYRPANAPYSRNSVEMLEKRASRKEADFKQ